MTITIGWWMIPTILTVIMLWFMLRGDDTADRYGIGAVFRILWLIPILVIWVVYLTNIVAFAK